MKVKKGDIVKLRNGNTAYVKSVGRKTGYILLYDTVKGYEYGTFNKDEIVEIIK